MNLIQFPVFRSLTKPILVFGMPRNIFVFIMLLTVYVVVGLGQIWFIMIAIPLFILFKITGSKDSHLFYIYFEVIKYPEIAD